MSPLPEPGSYDAGTKELFLDYLDFYRSVVASKLDGLSESDLRRSRLPSGWSPIELLMHLVHMERRWFRWGFAGELVDEPWGDHGPGGRWRVPYGTTAGELLDRLAEGGRRTRSIVEAASMDDAAAVGGRFDGSSTPPTLQWILFHVLQEYARHAGHLDIARELADGKTGEDG